MNQKVIMVTGAAGFIGSHTVDRLLSSGHRVVGVDDLSTGREENLSDARNHKSFEFEQLDITDSNLFEILVEKIRPDVVVHLAGLVSVERGEKEPMLNYRLNLHATQLVAEAARKFGIGRVVFASSAAVYGASEELPLKEEGGRKPINLYGSAKGLSEQLLAGYVHSYGLNAVALRFFNVYGPRQDPSSPYSGVLSIFVNRLRKGEPITIFGDGGQTRDFISVHDIVSGICLAATREDVASGDYNLCTGRSTSVVDVFNELRSHFPLAPDAEFGPERVGDIRDSLGDPSRAKEAFGFEAEVSIGEGLKELLES